MWRSMSSSYPRSLASAVRGRKQEVNYPKKGRRRTSLAGTESHFFFSKTVSIRVLDQFIAHVSPIQPKGKSCLPCSQRTADSPHTFQVLISFLFSLKLVEKVIAKTCRKEALLYHVHRWICLVSFASDVALPHCIVNDECASRTPVVSRFRLELQYHSICSGDLQNLQKKVLHDANFCTADLTLARARE